MDISIKNSWRWIVLGHSLSWFINLSRIQGNLEAVLRKRDNVGLTLCFSASWLPHTLCGYFCFLNWSRISTLENDINLSDEVAIFCAWNLGKTFCHLAPTSSWQRLTVETLQFTVLTGEYRSSFTVTLCCYFPVKNMALDFLLEFQVAQCLVPEYLIFFIFEQAQFI